MMDETKNGIAFFDFDGTVTHHDTLFTFARFAVGNAKLYWSVFKASPWIAAWKCGIISNSAAKERLISFLYKGMPYARFVSLGRHFITAIDMDSRVSTINLISKHKNKGDMVCIVSASVKEWIAPWAANHKIHNVLATELEVVDGKLTGRFATRNCHGAEKAARIRQAYPNIDAMASYAYGDSRGDNAMFALVQHPTKV